MSAPACPGADICASATLGADYFLELLHVGGAWWGWRIELGEWWLVRSVGA